MHYQTKQTIKSVFGLLAFFGTIIFGLSVIVHSEGGFNEMTWREFETPAGVVSCFGQHETIGGYDIAGECVEVDR